MSNKNKKAKVDEAPEELATGEPEAPTAELVGSEPASIPAKKKMPGPSDAWAMYLLCGFVGLVLGVIGFAVVLKVHDPERFLSRFERAELTLQELRLYEDAEQDRLDRESQRRMTRELAESKHDVALAADQACVIREIGGALVGNELYLYHSQPGQSPLPPVSPPTTPSYGTRHATLPDAPLFESSTDEVKLPTVEVPELPTFESGTKTDPSKDERDAAESLGVTTLSS